MSTKRTPVPRPSRQVSVPRGRLGRENPRQPRTVALQGGARRLVTLPAFRVGFVGTLGVGLALALIGAFQTISLVVTYVGVAYFLSLALEPVIEVLRRRRIRRPVAVALIFGVTVVLVAAAVLVVAPLVGNQLLSLVRQAPGAIQRLTQQPWVADVTAQFGLDASLEGLVNGATDFLRDPQHLASVGGGLVALGSGVVDGVVAVFAVLVLTIYLTATMPRVVRKAFKLVPASRADTWRPVYEEMTTSVGRFVVGQVTLAVINAVLVCVLLLVFDMPGVALLTVVAFIGALIPIVGTVVAAVIIIGVGLLTSPPAAIAMAIFYLGYQPLESYVLTPKVMARAVHVPGSLVLVAVLAGSALGGVLGALVAVPVAASATVLIDRIVVVRQRQH
ncbi:AI-2E family transporter [Frigoribacterium salinisoli]